MGWRENKRLAEVATAVTGTKHCLWCVLHDRRADTSCGDYEREPGSDDEWRSVIAGRALSGEA